jgi:PAS domain S-box-containing protein
MTIKRKIFTFGAVAFVLFVAIALTNVGTHRQILANLKIRDDVNGKLAAIQKFAKWKNELILLISDIAASGHVPLFTNEKFNAPSKSPTGESDLLATSGKTLVDLIGEKERASIHVEKSYHALRMKVNGLYFRLDEKIATVLAIAQMDQVLGRDTPEKSALAPYILKSLNQLTLVALNSLVSRNFTEEGKGVVEKNERFLSSQLQIIDPDGSIALLFDELSELIRLIDSYILKANQKLFDYEARIAKAKTNFNIAVGLNEIDYIVAEAQSELDRANETLEKSSRRTMIAVIIFLFLVPTVGIILSIFGLNRIIIGPITHLVDAMKTVETGDFDVEAPIMTHDEIGRLARAFNAMASEIKRKVTQLSRLNRTLKESEFKYRTLVDNLPQRVFLKDRDLKYVSCNRNFADDLGMMETEIVGKTDFDFFPVVLAEKYRNDDAKILLAETSQEIEESFIKEGRKIVVQTVKTPVRNETGQVTGVLSIFWDISERKRAEQELKKARNYIANIFDSMPSVLIGVDPSGTITQWNSRAQHITGVSAEDAVGRHLKRVFPEMSAELARVSEAIRTHIVQFDPKKSRKSDGEIFFEDVTIYPLTSNGVEGAVIRIDDVTEKVRMEEMMVQSEKMLSVGGLAAGMAHEINNPLAGMMQTADVMADRLGKNLQIPANREAAEAAGTTLGAVERFMKARGIQRMLATINESGKRVAAIVDNMLSFARKSEAAVSSHSLRELIDKTLELAATDYDLKKQYDFKMIEIERDYGDDLPLVPCEWAKIQQVLLNVFRNAAQAMTEAGAASPRIRVRTRLGSQNKMVVMEIEDNGPGMDEATRKRAFEPFFTTKPVGVGTGLGLSVSYFIITENHWGEMAVESEPGAGAKFIIRLPAAEKKQRR